METACRTVEVGGKFDQLAFRRYIVRSLMHSVNPSAPQSGPRPRPLDEVRKDGLNHHLSRNDKHIGVGAGGGQGDRSPTFRTGG